MHILWDRVFLLFAILVACFAYGDYRHRQNVKQVKDAIDNAIAWRDRDKANGRIW